MTRVRVMLALLAVIALAGAIALLSKYWLHSDLAAWLLTLVLGVGIATVVARAVLAPWARMVRALESVIANYRDGDFSVSLLQSDDPELGRLQRMHNELAQTLRAERKNLAERERLLETVVQNTPVALVLTDAQERVTFANTAARQLFNDGNALEGRGFAEHLGGLPPVVSQAVAAGEDTLFTVTLDGLEEVFHLSHRAFRLQGRSQRLYLFRRMTRELSRQEVVIWKKVIRVVTHEINNSLAPMSSMAHSGAELTRREQYTRLAGVFDAIRERAEHLHGFINGYARLAKLPAPRSELTSWNTFLGSLSEQVSFRITAPVPAEAAVFDGVQLGQALINLIKNAHESGSPPEDVELQVHRGSDVFRIEILDRGCGMNPTVLANALLPFYSTKRSGSGLGLALVREIIEGHKGRIQLFSRPAGGTRVSLELPASVPVVANSVGANTADTA